MGVISFGAAKCGTPGSPTVITKIGYYTNWIAKIMARVRVEYVYLLLFYYLSHIYYLK